MKEPKLFLYQGVNMFISAFNMGVYGDLLSLGTRLRLNQSHKQVHYESCSLISLASMARVVGFT